MQFSYIYRKVPLVLEYMKITLLMEWLCKFPATYPELFWADQYIHRTQNETNMVGTKWVIFANL